MFRFEKEAYRNGFSYIAGVDEAGRAPLAGPVVAAAVILPFSSLFFSKELTQVLSEVDDSKKLSPKKREFLYNQIILSAISYGIGIVSEKTIDQINILKATTIAMEKAVSSLNPKPEYLLIDGIIPLNLSIKQKVIIKGDSRSCSVAAASILAKVTRDHIMEEMHMLYPDYGFNRHKGYPTKLHLERINEFGPCQIHRKSFKGVKEFFEVSKNSFRRHCEER